MKCKNNIHNEYDYICLCDSKLDGSSINGWLPERLTNKKLAEHESREEVIKELESLANDAYCMWQSNN